MSQRARWRSISGFLTFLSLGLNIGFWTIPLVVFALIKLFLPFSFIRNLCDIPMIKVYQWTVVGNSWILKNFANVTVEINGVENLDPNQSYLVISNHCSWADILILHKTFNYKVPMLKTVVKQQLLFLPIIGLVCWAYEYPMMKRYSKEYLKAHPEKKTVDLQRLKDACARFRQRPACLLNFAEGTRFTAEKHKKTNSPYRFLLPPKPGGFSVLSEALDGTVKYVLNTTIIYDDPQLIFWNFIGRQPSTVTVNVEAVPMNDIIPPEQLSETVTRRDLAVAWLNSAWQKKEEDMSKYYIDRGLLEPVNKEES